MICEAPAGDGGSLLCISLGVFAAEFEKSAINVGCPEGLRKGKQCSLGRGSRQH